MTGSGARSSDMPRMIAAGIIGGPPTPRASNGPAGAGTSTITVSMFGRSAAHSTAMSQTGASGARHNSSTEWQSLGAAYALDLGTPTVRQDRTVRYDVHL